MFYFRPEVCHFLGRAFVYGPEKIKREIAEMLFDRLSLQSFGSGCNSRSIDNTHGGVKALATLDTNNSLPSPHFLLSNFLRPLNACFPHGSHRLFSSSSFWGRNEIRDFCLPSGRDNGKCQKEGQPLGGELLSVNRAEQA